MRTKPRTGWHALGYAAVHWLSFRRLVWLACIGLCGALLWAAGGHLGPALRAAHGTGIRGQWTAQQFSGGNWNGRFVASDGSVTLPNVRYEGSLPGANVGTVVPALDAGAADEVYPVTGSDRWIKDLAGVLAGSLALIALLARGFFVRRRRWRARHGDYLARAVNQPGYLAQPTIPGWRGRVRARRAKGPPLTRAGQAGILVIMAAVTGGGSGLFSAVLAAAWPAVGWHGPLAVAAGVVLAVAPVVALWLGVRQPASRPNRRPAPWAAWLLAGYCLAFVVGIVVCLSARYIPADGGPPAAPPPSTVVLVALTAEALTLAAITLLLLGCMAGVLLPGPADHWLQSRRRPGQPPPRHAQG